MEKDFGWDNIMQTRRLGNSDLMITTVGYGSWAIGGSGWEYAWGPQNDNDSISAIRRALALGVNWIDTAAVYGLGHAEEVVARAIAVWNGPRPFVFTKCGLTWDDQGRLSRKLTAESVRQECEASLRRLRVKVIDLYQVHWPPEMDAELRRGLGHACSTQKRRQSALDWRFELQCISDGSGTGNFRTYLSAAALLTYPTRNRDGDSAVLQAA